MAWIAPSKNVSSIINLTAGTQYPITAKFQASPPTGLSILDNAAVEEGTDPSVDTLHGTHYWQIATDGTTVYAISPDAKSGGSGGVYVASLGTASKGVGNGVGGVLSKQGLLFGSVGEEIAVVAAVVVVILVIAVIVHFKR